MSSAIKYFNKGASFPKGFKTKGVSAGIKKDKQSDLGLLVSQVPCVAAGVFTNNQFIAAPVKFSKDILKKNRKSQAIIVNSGNANACNGINGQKSVSAINNELSKQLNIDKDLLLQFSTGKIGYPLPVKKITSQIPSLIRQLSDNDLSFSGAIMTTDRFAKFKAAQFTSGKNTVKIGATVKGAGMIEPSMATMLCFIASDINIPLKLLTSLLKEITNLTFNKISVDGDMSTNDSVVILCNGLSGVKVKSKSDNAYKKFRESLLSICKFLSSEIIRDGEGATKIIDINVSQAKTFKDAEKVARSIANSLLLKCAIFGEKPNWGRILSSVGATNAKINHSKFSVALQNHVCFKNNEPDFKAYKKLLKAMKKKTINIEVKLGSGKHEYSMLASDLSFQYVEINK